MAESLAVLGLVCNIIQLVDGAANLVHLAKEIHKRGETAYISEGRSRLLAEHLRSSKDLVHQATSNTKLGQESRNRGFSSSEITLVGPEDDEKFDTEVAQNEESSYYDPDLNLIIDKACEIADDLLHKLDAYTYKQDEKRNYIKSMGKAMKFVFLEQKDIEEKSGLLSRYQKDLNTKLAVFSIYLLQRVESQNKTTHDGLDRIDRNIGNVKNDVGNVVTAIIADNEANANRLSRQVAGDAEKLHETLGGILEALRAPQTRQSEDWEVVHKDDPPPDPTPLFDAAQQGDKVKIREILGNSRVSIDSQNEHGQSALHLACYFGHVVVARFLRQNGAKLNAEDKEGSTPLHTAVRRDQVEVVRLLLGELQANADVHDNANKTPRDYAVRSKFHFLLLWMFSYGADVDAEEPAVHKTALMQAAENGDLMSVKRLLDENANIAAEDLRGSTALELATRSGSLECVQELLSRGAAIEHRNKDRLTPLMVAVATGRQALPVVEPLIKAGADTEAKNDKECTSVWQAFNRGNWEMAKLLVKQGAKISIKDSEGYPLLNRAAQAGRAAFVDVLLEHGADPNDINNDGYTPLHEAAHNGHPPVAQALLKNDKVNVNARDKWLYTPLQRACQKRRHNIVRQILATKKADVNSVNDSRHGHWGCLAEVCLLYRLQDADAQLEILKMLLAEGPNVNIQDSEGYTPLSRSVMGDIRNLELQQARANLARELLQAKDINVNQGNHGGWTPLMEASFYGNVLAINVLLEHKADIEARGAYHDAGDIKATNVTALMLAAKGGHRKAIETLLNAQPPADINAKDSRDYTALTIAVKHGRTQPAFALALKGADVEDTLRHESEIKNPESKTIIEQLKSWNK